MTAPRLGPAQKDILGVLAEGPATTADLRKRTGHDAQVIRMGLRRMAGTRPGRPALAYIAKERTLGDRKSLHVWDITEAGRAVLEGES